MAVKMMKWKPWPPLASRKFEANLTIRNMSGCCELCKQEISLKRFKVEIKWPGPKMIALRKKENINQTKESEASVNGEVEWNEKFQNICSFSSNKDKLNPYEVSLTVISEFQKKSRKKTAVIGTSLLDLAEFGSAGGGEHELTIELQVLVPSVILEKVLSLRLCLSLFELRSAPEHLPRPIECVPLSPRSRDAFLRKVRMLTKSRKEFHEQEGSDKSEYADYCYTDFEDEEDEEKGCYFSLTSATANLAGEGSFSGANDWIFPQTGFELPPQNSKRRLLSWRKRKLSFKKGEPLLKKYYGEEGGDDIDFDRRQVIKPEKHFPTPSFGEDSFKVGRWERKEVTSRDGKMSLETLVFFASIDQRSEQASGESACAVLVAILANWLLCNKDQTPIQSQFDTLIRQGSSEWRKLCENEIYRTIFPDKHFDLETILRSNIHTVTTISERSFIGFFHPELDLAFLDGAMSFDEIWSEISGGSEEEDDPAVYIVSWNDHFFVLKVEKDAYYIVDTLGERLCEGCDQAFVLKFDRSSIVRRVGAGELQAAEGVVCRGKDACKEYILGFLAAVPVGEVKADVKKGLKDTAPIHRRLQIEFHYTRLLQHPVDCSV